MIMVFLPVQEPGLPLMNFSKVKVITHFVYRLVKLLFLRVEYNNHITYPYGRDIKRETILEQR